MGGLVTHQAMKNLLLGGVTDNSTEQEVLSHLNVVARKVDEMLRHYSIPVTNSVPRDIVRARISFKEEDYLEGLSKICAFIDLAEVHSTTGNLVIYDIQLIRETLDCLPVKEMVGV